MRLLIFLALWASVISAAQYSARREGDVIRLEDSGSSTVVSIVPSVNNIAFEMKVHGKNALAFPFASVEDFKAHPTITGIPFLGPWANRLDETAFYANGKKYIFNMGLGNVRGPHPIHGLVTATPLWQVIEVRADKGAAWATSRLAFYRVPNWMAQFPFAHTVEMTYRLQKGVLASPDAASKSQHRSHAGCHRLSSLLPLDRLQARRLENQRRRAHSMDSLPGKHSDRRDPAD